MDKRAPNVLLIVTDQQRFDSLGAYGSKVVPTPNLDALAEDGATFDNCYVNCTICTPSRASIWTGKSMIGHGVSTVHDILPDGEQLFPEHLRRLGYETALFGKLHVSGRVYEREHRHPHDGFDIYEYGMSPHAQGGMYNSYQSWLQSNHPSVASELRDKGRNMGSFPRQAHFTHWVAERTCDFIEHREREAPFFCYLGIVDPHDPYNDYPLEMNQKINMEEMPLPARREGEMDSAPEAVRREHAASYLGGFDEYTPEQITQMRRGYFASIALLDEEVGRVLNKLDEAGLRENTLVIFTSDHGDMLGDHELLAKGGFFFDPSTKVPMIIRFPGRVPVGARLGAVVQPHAIAGTVCRAAGMEEAQLQALMPDSTDLVGAARRGTKETDKPANEPGYAVCLYRNTGISRNKLHWDPPIHGTMLCDGRYKLNCYHGSPGTESEGELYDLREDPGEFNNLWAREEYQATKEQLLILLLDWMAGQNQLYHDGRGGVMFPPKTQWVLNNPI